MSLCSGRGRGCSGRGRGHCVGRFRSAAMVQGIEWRTPPTAGPGVLQAPRVNRRATVVRAPRAPVRLRAAAPTCLCLRRARPASRYFGHSAPAVSALRRTGSRPSLRSGRLPPSASLAQRQRYGAPLPTGLPPAEEALSTDTSVRRGAPVIAQPLTSSFGCRGSGQRRVCCRYLGSLDRAV